MPKMRVPECGRCHGQRRRVPMQMIYQANDVYRFRCPACNLHGDLQVQNGQWVQVQVQVEYGAPESVGIGTRDKIQIPVAYTLGTPSASSRVAANPPTESLEPAYTLGGDQAELGPSHPMHPMNIRRRLMGG